MYNIQDIDFSKKIYEHVLSSRGTVTDTNKKIDKIIIQMTSDRKNCERDTHTNFYSAEDLKLKEYAHYVVGSKGVCKYLPTIEKAVISKDDPSKTYSNAIVVELLWNNVFHAEVELIRFLASCLFRWNMSTSSLIRREDIFGGKDIYLSLYNKKDNWNKLISSVDAALLSLKSTEKKNKEIREFNKKEELKEKPKMKKTLPLKISGPFKYSEFPSNDNQWKYEKVAIRKETKPADAGKIHEEEDFENDKMLGGKVNKFTGEAIRDFNSELKNFEPVYPDLTVPPRGNPSMYAKQIIDIEDEVLEHKRSVGDLVNKDAPYPVEQKLAELQAHRPKVKIEEAEAIGLGEAKAWFLSMSERIEKRLVQLENITSTNMRYLHRLSSRININCVYYGGQCTYYKYKGIRCLNDDLTADRAIVTLDQCLNCSRYEPIIGQVYDILDDNMQANIAPILDDNQMARSNMDEYISSVKTNMVTGDLKRAKFDLNKVNEEPKDTITEEADKKLQEGKEESYFIMDWEETELDKNTPDINQYEHSPAIVLEDKYPRLDDPFENGYKDITKLNIVIPPDSYAVGGGGGIDSIGGGMGSDARIKIVERAEELYKLCQEGKAQYSQAKRDSVINGITYRDCSSLANDCYKAAGLPGAGGSSTGAMYDYFVKQKKGQVVKNQKDAKPGDLLLWRDNSSGHAAIYIGDGKMIDASKHHKDDSTKDFKKRDVSVYNNWSGSRPFIGFCRTDELVQADKQSGVISLDGFPKWYLQADAKDLKKHQSALKNMNKFGYKNAFMKACSDSNMDPNLMFGIATVESNGDPNCSGRTFQGLMQVAGGPIGSSPDIVYKNVTKAIKHLRSKEKALSARSILGLKKPHMHLTLQAYNSGEGTAKKVMQLNGLMGRAGSLTIDEVIKAYLYVWDKHRSTLSWGNDTRESRAYYGARVLYHAAVLTQMGIFTGPKNSTFS